MFTILFPKRVNRRCPETILAINRILSVKGRIDVLINSIKTINLIRAVGVPLGTKWANILFVKVTHPKIKNPVHIGTDKNKFVVKCLVAVNELGINPHRLERTIKRKIDKNISLGPSFLDFKAISNCSAKYLSKIVFEIEIRVGLIQNLKNIKIKKTCKINQFISLEKIDNLLLGSKETKRLNILLLKKFFFNVFFSSFEYLDSIQNWEIDIIQIKEIIRVNTALAVFIGKIWYI